MSQAKGTVKLNPTVLKKLQALVTAGDYETVNDAANYLLMGVLLGSTTPVLSHNAPTSPQDSMTSISTPSKVPTTHAGVLGQNGAEKASTTPVLTQTIPNESGGKKLFSLLSSDD